MVLQKGDIFRKEKVKGKNRGDSELNKRTLRETTAHHSRPKLSIMPGFVGYKKRGKWRESLGRVFWLIPK